MSLPWDQRWYKLFDALGVSSFFDFISSSDLQLKLLPIKIVFILFTLFFLAAVIYFYMNSSYLRYQFLQDANEFFSWQAYGLREINRHWKSITRKIKTGSEKEYKLAILEADDFLREELEDADYRGTVEEMIENAGRKIMPNSADILEAHKVRNTIVQDINYKLDVDLAKKVLSDYEKAIKSIYSY